MDFRDYLVGNGFPRILRHSPTTVNICPTFSHILTLICPSGSPVVKIRISIPHCHGIQATPDATHWQGSYFHAKPRQYITTDKYAVCGSSCGSRFLLLLTGTFKLFPHGKFFFFAFVPTLNRAQIAHHAGINLAGRTVARVLFGF